MDASRSRPVSNRRGQALSEYAMLVAIVGMGLVVILGLFGRATKQVWQNNERKFADEPAPVSGGTGGAPYTGGGGSAGASSGGGVASSGGRPHAPPPPPKNDAADSTSASADSVGSSPDTPPDIPQDVAQGSP